MVGAINKIKKHSIYVSNVISSNVLDRWISAEVIDSDGAGCFTQMLIVRASVLSLRSSRAPRLSNWGAER